MIIKDWAHLPTSMQTDAVRPYYEILQSKKGSLLVKMIFDRLVALIMLVLVSPILLVIGILIKQDSPGGIFFRQERITQYGKVFRIYKFRTMVKDAEQLGAQVTTKNDMRITKIGSKLRGTRLDESPQLINILLGHMSFVGTRPEVAKYVNQYTDEMMATLLLPAGVTSKASIEFKDEEKLLSNVEDADATYVEKVLPLKMQWNLQSVRKFSFFDDLKTMVATVLAVLK